MKHVFTSKVVRIAVAVGIAAVFVPVAYAQGGAVSHVYAPPPLDAGSAVPNPDYVRGGVVIHTYAPPPLDAGSAVPNPDYVQKVRSGSVRPDDRASRATVHSGLPFATVISRSTGDSFDWADAGIGAAGTFAVVLVAAGSAIGIQRSRQRPASA